MGGSGSGVGTLIKLLLTHFDDIAGPVLSLAYPLYASIRAIESRSAVDDQQWLTYWVFYSMITLFELTFARAIQWIPFWLDVKLFLICWLVIPQFRGASYMYEKFVRPFFVNSQTVNIWNAPEKKVTFGKKPDDTSAAADTYIQENSSDNFRADKEMKHGTSSYDSFEYYKDDYVYDNVY